MEKGALKKASYHQLEKSAKAKRTFKLPPSPPLLLSPSSITAEKTVSNMNVNDLAEMQNVYWNEEELKQRQTTERFDRKDLRTFRIERLFRGPNGDLFVFGCYYARPHETFCDSSRMFYKNEVSLRSLLKV